MYYRIENTVSGQDLGVWEADSPEEAIALMLAEAGCEDEPEPTLIAHEIGDEVVIVSDGQFAWGAFREELLAALTELGWESDSYGRWTEPESDPDNELTSYDELCWRVEPVPGFGPDDQYTDLWDALSSFTWQVEIGYWIFDEDTAPGVVNPPA